jgi:hypothetical protein
MFRPNPNSSDEVNRNNISSQIGGGVSPLLPMRSMAKKLNRATALREHEKATPHRAGIAAPPGRESTADQDRKARLIGRTITPGSAAPHPRESGTDRSRKRQGRATDRRGQHPTHG